MFFELDHGQETPVSSSSQKKATSLKKTFFPRKNLELRVNNFIYEIF